MTTEPERKKDGQLLIPFEKQLQLAIQFKKKQIKYYLKTVKIDHNR